MIGAVTRWWAGDVGYSFRNSPLAIAAAVVAFVCIFCAVFAGWVAPHNPFDLATLELGDSRLPPAWTATGRKCHPWFRSKRNSLFVRLLA